MARYTVEPTTAGGFIPQGEGMGEEELEDLGVDYDSILEDTPLPDKDGVLAELDRMIRLVRVFWKMEPDEVMRAVSAFGARCTELYQQLHRVEGKDRTWRQVRTQQVVPLMDELERQYKNASRLLEVRRQDIEYSRGQR